MRYRRARRRLPVRDQATKVWRGTNPSAYDRIFMRILFLDIDGVLNSTRFMAENTNGEGVIVVDGELDATAHIDPIRVGRLNRLITETNAVVVLSSSWRVVFGIQKTQSSLRARGFAHVLADTTIRIVDQPRAAEIEHYLARLGGQPSFVILDDDRGAGIGFDRSFVHIPDGMEDEHVERAKRVLLEPNAVIGRRV